MKPALTALLALAALAPAATSQSFAYPDFSSVAGLSLVGMAAQNGTQLRVHNNSGASPNRGAAWYSTPVEVVNGFDTTFHFNMNGPVGGGADGMAFVIHNDTNPGTNNQYGTASIGRHASGIGYGIFTSDTGGAQSVENSLAIELDTYGGSFDPDNNHISVHTNGTGDNNQIESYSLGRATSATLGVDLNNGATHTLRIHYVPGTLEVYLNGVLKLTTAYDFTTGGTWVDSGTPVGGLSLIGGTSAYVGFTASSGAVLENHDVIAWTWDSGPGPVAFCDPGSSGVMACPCANPPSGAARGCENSEATGGASIVAAGSADLAADTLVFTTASQTAYGTTVLMQGTANNGTGLPFGQGVRCVDGGLKRLYVKSPGGAGGITAPAGGDASVSAVSASLGDTILAGEHRYYMAYYRDPVVLGGCPVGATYNGTNAIDVTWD